MVRIFTLVCLCCLCVLPSFRASAQNVFIPDSNFKNYLLSQPSINRNRDGQIQVSEARLLTVLNVTGKNIADLTGIRAFTALTDLRCSNNTLSALDLRDVSSLRILYATNNQLSSLNIASNNNLQYLDVRRNRLTTLNFGTNTKLINLNCETNQLTSLDVSGQPKLNTLICSHNNLVALQVNRNPGLTTLICAFNSIRTLNVSGNTMLSILQVYNNALTSLDLRTNGMLQVLQCNHNQLTQLDVSSNTGLMDLRCYVNQIANLELGDNPNMASIMAFQNQLTALNVSQLPALRTLQVQFNQITALDLKENRALTGLDLRKNLLQSLDVRNGNNTSITSFNARLNPPLKCIAVDNPAWSAANWPNHDPAAEYEITCEEGGPVVFIPDANFKAALVGNSDINTNGDGEIQVSEAGNYVGGIEVPNMNIRDMTGVEAFHQLNFLDCENNQISMLDLSGNPELNFVNCRHNQITEILWPDELPMREFNGDYNLLTHFDMPSRSTLVVNLSHNQLTSFRAGGVDISTIDISFNQFTTFDASEYKNLYYLTADNNLLTSVQFATDGSIGELSLRNNRLTTMDVSMLNYPFRLLYVTNNALTSLNIAAPSLAYFQGRGNPELTCITVHDIGYAEENWREYVDPGTSFSTDCSAPPVVYIPDANFKAALVGNSDINTNGDDEIQFSEADSYVGSISVTYMNIQDMTGLEAFRQLTRLECQNNQITRLDLSYNSELFVVNCRVNQITEILWPDESSMYEFWGDHNRMTHFDMPSSSIGLISMSANQLTSFDASVYRVLNYLNVDDNQLTSLELNRENGYLELVSANNNKLTSMDVSNIGYPFRYFYIQNNALTSLNIAASDLIEFWGTGNPGLTCITVLDIGYAETNWRDNVDPGVTFSYDCGDAGFTLTAWPNPSSGRVNIASNEAIGEVRVLDMSGALVTQQSGANVDLGALRPGTYFMQVQVGDRVSVVKVVRE